jgi:hypothetical protein
MRVTTVNPGRMPSSSLHPRILEHPPNEGEDSVCRPPRRLIALSIIPVVILVSVLSSGVLDAPAQEALLNPGSDHATPRVLTIAPTVVMGPFGIFVPGPNPIPPFTGTTIDFEGFSEGTLINLQFIDLGVTFTQHDGGMPMIDNKPFLFAYESGSGGAVLTGSTTGGAPFPTVAGLVVEFSQPVTRVGAFLSDTAPLGDNPVIIFDEMGSIIDRITVSSSDFPTIPGFPGPNEICDQSSPLEGTGCGVFVGFDVGSSIIRKIQFGPSTAFGDAFAIDNLIFTAGGPPEIQIVLDPPPDNRYVIDEIPAMPIIQGKAKVINVTPDPTPTATFMWTINLRINKINPSTCEASSEVSYDTSIVQSSETIADDLFTMQFINPNAFRGGRLKLTATATVDGEELNGETPSNLRIEGTNPQRASIQTEIDLKVPTDGFSGLQAADIQDVLKRIGCQESGQRQFKASADGGIGPTLISCDNGVGIFQITTTNLCPDPYTTCPNTLFKWPDNVVAGVLTYQGKVRVASGYPVRLRLRQEYREFIASINAQRQAAGLGPIFGFPAPAFTTTGQIGSDPSNQLLEDGVRGYNGFAGTAFGIELHEFTPDRDFLLTVPNSELGNLRNNPRVWRRVLPAERPSAGDPNYVDNVRAQSPQCGG